MKRHAQRLGAAFVSFLIFGVGAALVFGPSFAAACGYGGSGGQGYTPQRRGNPGYIAQRPALSQNQVADIVARHVRRLNPDLNVGKVTDAGGLYEAEIVSKDGEVVQLMGVDKYSGRMTLIE